MRFIFLSISFLMALWVVFGVCTFSENEISGEVVFHQSEKDTVFPVIDTYVFLSDTFVKKERIVYPNKTFKAFGVECLNENAEVSAEIIVDEKGALEKLIMEGGDDSFKMKIKKEIEKRIGESRKYVFFDGEARRAKFVLSFSCGAEYDEYEGMLVSPIRKMPLFVGCKEDFATESDMKKCSDRALMKYVEENLSFKDFPCEDVEGGRIIANFTLTADGWVSDPRVLRTPCPEFDEKIIEMLEGMPTWKRPAFWYKGFVDVKFNLPIRIRKE